MKNQEPDCLNCRHMDEFQLICIAFPHGIPENILRGEPHIKPIAGQKNEVVFEPIPSLESQKILLDTCKGCINYWGNSKCRAFPHGIPREMIKGETEHKKPFPGQNNDIVFEAMVYASEG